MTSEKTLSDQQKQYMDATLSRIREGLAKKLDPNMEPSHFFYPEAFSERTIDR